jgi:hypothetical protein
MSMTTYNGLKASIANWLNRTDLATEIPDFIRLVESRIAHEVRIPTIEKKVIVTIDSEGKSTIPSDFLEVKDVFYNDRPLQRLSGTQLRSYVQDSGTPQFFAREAGKLMFFPTPTPTASDTLEMVYYYEVDALTDSNQTNVLLQTIPELYLYGALAEAGNFLGSDNSRWEAGYQNAFSRMMAHLRYSEFSGATPEVGNGY